MTQHPQTSTPAQPAGTLHELDPAQVHQLLRERRAVLIDVREPGEFAAERIPGALLAPLSGFDPDSLPLDTVKRIIFQCGSGRRSAQAAHRVLASGQRVATHLAGGISAWKRAGLAIIAYDPATGQLRKGAPER